MPKYKSAKFMFKDDPNNKRWAEDKSRLGFKLLEKMGWKEGDGLGKKRDGMTEHVKVAFKTDTAGIGAHEEAKKERTVCQKMSSFSEVLARLKTTTKQDSSSSEDESTEKSKTEEEPKTKTNRIHHHRRARSKMTSNYSQEDLAAILGKSPLTSETKSNEKTKKNLDLGETMSSPTINTTASTESEKKRKRKEKKEKKEKKKKIEDSDE